MAAATLPRSHSPFDPSLDARRKKVNGQQKKEELEREVMMLREMLDQEEKAREILERVQNDQHRGSAISIPNSLPPKMKDLLAELAMVEGEISRLEIQISHLQINLKQEQEETTRQAACARSWRNMNNNYNINPKSIPPSMPSSNYPNFPPPSPMVNKGANNTKNNRTTTDHSHGEKTAPFETKALHFINKAIKGHDYVIGTFDPSEKVGGFDKESNRSIQQESVNLKKSRMMKSPSPLREPRYSSPKPKDRIALDTSLDIPPKSLSSTILTEDGQNIQNWHPNKLAESIMKCLNFIFVRLLRTTRAMELEKSGPISRATPFSLSSRSFRVDQTTTNLSKSMNLGVHKESRQQDPYGIFDAEASLPRDVGPYKNLVIFTSSSMDPKCISSSSSVSLIKKLRVLMNNLETVDLRVLNHQQKLAFWINMYNACVMHGFLQRGVPKTAEKMFGLIEQATINVGGKIISANAIERYILRKPVSSNMTQPYDKNEEHKEMIIHKLYGVDPTDPNITFALSCGTRSSPAVRIYTAEGVVTELEKSKLEYLQASVVVTEAKRIGLPELLLRHAGDFSGSQSLVEWVCNQLPTSGSLRKSMVDCFRTHHHHHHHHHHHLHDNNAKPSSSSSSHIVEKIPYDYEFQYLLAI
ncbi:PREDICTED: uncharacterized protein LOC104810866 isoform X2 [Tarenaya hassleriana]|uniref:uncharacterized protein LOC104810866 isoform X2 n=1 Tax=Tarenaya hassleriana TaxID=28532 RepID=UPI00053C1E84|nr:PREDICTED: uncharacterized protein LOC104810866 isoform X2 [Tarenaya hassleriana]